MTNTIWYTNQSFLTTTALCKSRFEKKFFVKDRVYHLFTENWRLIIALFCFINEFVFFFNSNNQEFVDNLVLIPDLLQSIPSIFLKSFVDNSLANQALNSNFTATLHIFLNFLLFASLTFLHFFILVIWWNICDYLLLFDFVSYLEFGFVWLSLVYLSWGHSRIWRFSCKYLNTNYSKTPNITFWTILLSIQQFRWAPLFKIDFVNWFLLILIKFKDLF